MVEYIIAGAALALVFLIIYLIRKGAGAEIREALERSERERLETELTEIEKVNAENYKIEVEEREGYESLDTRSAADRLNDALAGMRKNRNRPGNA